MIIYILQIRADRVCFYFSGAGHPLNPRIHQTLFDNACQKIGELQAVASQYWIRCLGIDWT
jgi:hypothetical protein